MSIYNLVSLFGIVIFMGIAWLLSSNRKVINWRVIVWGIGFQMVFALFIFLLPAGTKLFLFINHMVTSVLDSATAGSKFIFGRLALAPGTVDNTGETSLGFFFAFQALPTIIFFSALMSILYYVGILPRIIRGFSFIFTRCMKISGAESLSAASNIFIGVESALTIKPHLREMTRSELCTVLSVGMATVASNVLAVYVFSLKNLFPTIAGHLVSASFLSAPAALIMSKIILPETELPKTLGKHIHPHYEKEQNLFEAIILGANTGVRLIVGIVALLVAVLGLIALSDLCLAFAGEKLNTLIGIQFDWSFKSLLGYLFYPLTLLLGIPLSDVGIISQIIGERVIMTEIVSYKDLAIAIENDLIKHPRSIVVTAYALCGFAHVTSMAIFIGGISAIVPDRINTLSQIGFKALIASTLACLMTACIAGVFFIKSAIQLNI